MTETEANMDKFGNVVRTGSMLKRPLHEVDFELILEMRKEQNLKHRMSKYPNDPVLHENYQITLKKIDKLNELRKELDKKYSVDK